MRVPLSNDADEGLPRVVRRNPTKLVKKLCVNCLTPLEKGSELGGWLVPQDYYCSNCGYKGYVYLEDRRGEDAAQGSGREETAAGPRRP
jgi:hypothetical protein